MSQDAVTEFMRSIVHDKEIMEQLVGYARRRVQRDDRTWHPFVAAAFLCQ